jgi:hypothetical protein
MSKVSKNIITQGLSGKLGDTIVFRQRAGETIVSVKPSKTTKEPTAKQLAVQEKFQKAILYGKQASGDPQSKAAYAEKAHEGQSAFNVAVADFFSAPEIQEIDVSEYTGVVGSKIKVVATDDFKVAEVKVTIQNSDNTLVEEGNAVMNVNGIDWIYTATVANASLAGDKIMIEVSDIPGNETSVQQVM